VYLLKIAVAKKEDKLLTDVLLFFKINGIRKTKIIIINRFI